jgi:hypothetical protein
MRTVLALLVACSGLGWGQVEEVRRAIEVTPAEVSEVQAAEETEAGATTLVLAYDTHYMFRGASYGRHIGSMDLSHGFQISERWSSTLGTWIGVNPEGQNGSFSEVDLYARLDYALEDWVVGLTSTLYTYYDVPWELEPEVGIHVDRTFGGVDCSALLIHDFVAKGDYFQLSGTKSIECNDWLALEPSALVAVNHRYFIQDQGLSHVGLSLAASLQVADHAVLRPYVTYNVGLDAALDSGLVQNQLFGGVSLAFDF